MVDPLAGAVRAAAAGESEAFAVIVRATQPDVARLCAALVDAGSAEDLVQETYLRAFRALPSYAHDAPVRTWVLGIARHVCVDEVRSRTRRRRLLRRAAPAVSSVQPAAATELRLLIAGLPDDRREAFVLTQVVGLSYEEAAAACGCPVGTIRSRVARARAALVDAVTSAIAQ